MLWDFTGHTDRKINAKNQFTIKDHKNNCLFIELIFPLDKNLSAEEFGKITKYKILKLKLSKHGILNP